MSLRIDIKKRLASFTLEVSMEVGNEIVGFLGESGCGKSMTLKCIAGIETPDEGIIVVNGETYFDSAAKVNVKPQKRKTALLFQNFQLFPHMTVEANIAAGIDRKLDSASRKAIVDQQVRRFALTGMEKRYPYHLSGGQQQRVALARMLAANPGILMLDEPFSALDAHLKELLEQNLIGLFESYGGSILYVSHDIDEALRFCDRIAVVQDGRIMEVSTGAELVHSPQSEASLKLSGCKNVTDAVYEGDHRVFLPRWGVHVGTEQQVPRDVSSFGVRASYLELADGPGDNVFRVRCDRVTDSRFERTIMCGFVDAELGERAVERSEENEMGYLHQHMIWRLRKPTLDTSGLPGRGDEVYVRIPPEKIYLVNR